MDIEVCDAKERQYNDTIRGWDTNGWTWRDEGLWKYRNTDKRGTGASVSNDAARIHKGANEHHRGGGAGIDQPVVINLDPSITINASNANSDEEIPFE